jgi:hypothetical protein
MDDEIRRIQQERKKAEDAKNGVRFVRYALLIDLDFFQRSSIRHRFLWWK